MHFRPFLWRWVYVFLNGKSADPNPLPLLVENSTNFFFWNLPLGNNCHSPTTTTTTTTTHGCHEGGGRGVCIGFCLINDVRARGSPPLPGKFSGDTHDGNTSFLMSKDTRSQGFTFLCCCDLKSKGTRLSICDFFVCWVRLQVYNVTLLFTVVTFDLRMQGHEYVKSFFDGQGYKVTR